MPKTVAPLTDTQIKKAKFDESKKVTKLFDGKGLYLLIDKSNNKFWRFEYQRPYTKKSNTLSFGDYPTVTLAEARKQRDDARNLLAQDLDPQVEKQRITNEVVMAFQNTFESVGKEWYEKQDYSKSSKSGHKRIFLTIYSKIGKIPVSKVTAVDVLNVCRIYEKKEQYETAKKIKNKCSQILRYAVATGRADRDPTVDLKGALKIQETKSYAALTETLDFAPLLYDIDHYQGTIITKIALKMTPLVFTRPGELRHAKWEDIDFDEAIWAYTPPKTKKKTGVRLIVPLAKQVIELLKILEPITKPYSEYVFPAATSNSKVMSENTINQALRRLGYSGEEQTAHGFRAIARTQLDEVLDYDDKLTEMQIGHRVRDMHGRTYNRTKHLDKRRKMMQEWADYCDKLKLEYAESIKRE